MSWWWWWWWWWWWCLVRVKLERFCDSSYWFYLSATGPSTSFKVHVQSLLHILILHLIKFKENSLQCSQLYHLCLVNLFLVDPMRKICGVSLFKASSVCFFLSCWWLITPSWAAPKKMCIICYFSWCGKLNCVPPDKQTCFQSLFAFFFVYIYLLCVSVSRGDIKALGCRVRGRRVSFETLNHKT